MHTYDIEVFKHDWVVVFKDVKTKEYSVFHNDTPSIRQFMTKDKLLGGFNSKHYDQYVLNAILGGADNAMVKEVNDFVISGRQGFEHWFIQQNRVWFDNFDVRDDMQMGLSLKAIEGHLGMNIEESPVPFDLDRPLTETELNEVIKYCKHDVDATEHLIEIRKPYLQGKIELGRLKGISDTKALACTNAKLTALFLEADKREWKDEREYQYPSNLTLDFIPDEIKAFFDQVHNADIVSEDLFKSKLKITLGDCPCVYGFGGVHGAIPTYIESATENRVILNYDVASLYPSLMLQCNYISRNIPSADIYRKVYNDRLEAKANGDMKTAYTLKLVLNTCYGAMLNKYNNLYDPLMGRSVCISGQLYMTELLMRYIKFCPTITIINFNTDGIMFSIDKCEQHKIATLNKEWETRTGFVLEEDVIDKVVQKDVNNLIVMSGEKIKTVGGYVNYGISSKGAWNVNNNATIVKKAIVEYFTKNTPIEKTIGDCNEMSEFQMIAKAGTKYKDAYWLVDGEKFAVQKVNRVYPSNDAKYGKIFKIKLANGSEAKIESLPEHCIIDNNNKLDIHSIDKNWYIELAQKRVNDFLGIKPKKIDRRKMTQFQKQILKILK